MELLSPVQIVRDSIATITQILADREIPVSQQGMKAYVAYNEVTGEPTRVVLPYLPDDASDELILSVQGFLDHEVGHLLFTDRKALLSIAHDEQLLEMQNIFEDPYVERRMRERFPGSRDNFNKLFDLFLDKIVDRNFQKVLKSGETNPMAFFGVLFPAIVRSWADVSRFTEYMNDKWTHVQPIIDKIDTDLIERVPYTKDTWENIDIGREVLLQIMRDPADDLDDSDMSSEADADGKLGSDDIKPKKPSSPSSEGGRSSGSRSIADEEGDHMDEEPEDEEKDESEGGDEHEEEDFDEPESESAGSASDDDDDDEEGEEEDDEKAEGADSEEPEKEESDVETGSKMDADAEIDGDIDEKVVGDDKAAEFDDDDEEEEEEGKDTWKPSSETEFLDHSIGDLDDAMSEEISVMARASAESSDYVIPTTDHDLIEPAPIVCSQSVAESRVVTLDKEVRDVASAIQLDFERAFVSQQKSYWKGGQTRGAINPSQLSRIRTGDMRVFRTREVRKTQDFDVQLVIDCSGSMHGTRMKLAIEAAYAMGVALDSIGINFEIIGFTSRDDVHLEGTKRDDKFAYARLDAIYMPVFKDFGEIWSPTVMQRLASWSQPSRGVLLQNVDGESLMLAAKRLAGQPSSGKAMIVLSDGSPCCSTESSAALIRHLKKTTKMIENAGINLVGIGIQHSGVGNYFTNYTVLHELSTLPTTVVSKVRDIILGL